MRSDSNGDDYESLATLARVSRDCSIRQTQRHTMKLLLVSVEDEDSRRLRHVVVDARDRRERGGKQPSREARTRRVFPRPTYKASSTGALRCSGAANSCEYGCTWSSDRRC